MVPIEPQRLNQAERNKRSEQKHKQHHRLKSRMIREKRMDLQTYTQHMIRQVRVRFEMNERKIRQQRWIALPTKAHSTEGMGNMEGNKEDEAKQGLTFPRVRTHHEITPCSAFSQGFTKARKRNGCEISKVSTASTSAEVSGHHNNKSAVENAALLSKRPQQNTPSGPKARRKRSPQGLSRQPRPATSKGRGKRGV